LDVRLLVFGRVHQNAALRARYAIYDCLVLNVFQMFDKLLSTVILLYRHIILVILYYIYVCRYLVR